MNIDSGFILSDPYDLIEWDESQPIDQGVGAPVPHIANNDEIDVDKICLRCGLVGVCWVLKIVQLQTARWGMCLFAQYVICQKKINYLGLRNQSQKLNVTRLSMTILFIIESTIHILNKNILLILKIG